VNAYQRSQKCLNRSSKAKTIAENANVQLTHGVDRGELLYLFIFVTVTTNRPRHHNVLCSHKESFLHPTNIYK